LEEGLLFRFGLLVEGIRQFLTDTGKVGVEFEGALVMGDRF